MSSLVCWLVAKGFQDFEINSLIFFLIVNLLTICLRLWCFNNREPMPRLLLLRVHLSRCHKHWAILKHKNVVYLSYACTCSMTHSHFLSVAHLQSWFLKRLLRILSLLGCLHIVWDNNLLVLFKIVYWQGISNRWLVLLIALRWRWWVQWFWYYHNCWRILKHSLKHFLLYFVRFVTRFFNSFLKRIVNACRVLWRCLAFYVALTYNNLRSCNFKLSGCRYLVLLIRLKWLN